jgi:hypothetical protein
MFQIIRNQQPDGSVPFVTDQGVCPIYTYMKQDYFEYLNLYTPGTLPDVKFIYELEMLHIKDWHSNFFSTKGIFENTCVSPSILNKIRDGKGYLLLSTIMESFLDDRMFDLMHDYLKTYNIPPTQVIYLTDSPNSHVIYERYCNKNNIQSKINCEYLPSWMLECRDQLLKSPSVLNRTYRSGFKNKTFLNFNRRYRPQRFWFLMQMFQYDILDQFYISFDKIQPEGHMDFYTHAKMINTQCSIGLDYDELESLNKLLPLILDTTDFSKFPMEKSLNETTSYYDDSLINIISETEFYTDILQLTEKTFKPIMYQQPFIMIGPPFSLKLLHSYGFKTFNELWDESYDEITDHEMRMKFIFNLVKNISDMSPDEKIELSHKAKEIVEYNYQHFIDRKPIEIFNFIEKYGI